MRIKQISFDDIPQFSVFDKAFNKQDKRLSSFLNYPSELESFDKAIKTKKFGVEQRNILYKSLTSQYCNVEKSTSVEQNLELILLENTFTVTTAHQPSLFTGPLYFIYKIAGTINLCRQLKKNYPNFNFIPFYFMGSEDHDFEEINHLELFGKKISWEDKQGGPVGKYNLKNFEKVKNELFEILGESPEANELKKIVQNSFLTELTYEEAIFRFVHHLFYHHGLLIILANNSLLKRRFLSIMKDDLLQNSSFNLVNETVLELEKEGFSNQAYARPINLFYLLPGKRERIEKEGDLYKVLNTEITFTEAEILKELEQFPERFSPNVILRPLYQEYILPNIAYIGGGGELAYWVERKSQFDYYSVHYPILIRRNSLQWFDKNSLKKLEKLGIKPLELFWDTDMLIRHFLEQNAETELNFADERLKLQETFSTISEKVKNIDGSLEASVAAQQAQLFNALEKLEMRLIRSEKQKQETNLNQLKNLQNKMGLPGSLQERRENFISLYLRYGQGLIDFLVERLNPLEKDFLFVFE